jgi:hypothetical protein
MTMLLTAIYSFELGIYILFSVLDFRTYGSVSPSFE